jgi:HSP20 family protein
MSTDQRTIPVGIHVPTLETGSGAPPANGGNGNGNGLGEFKETRVYQTPLIDIHEGPEGLVLEADLPGGVEEDVNIQLADNVLTLYVKINAPVLEGARPLHEEFRQTDFYRSFILSDEVERSKITADFKNGVLRLCLPKADRAKTRRIEIKS